MARVKYYDQASQEWKYADAALNMKGKDGYTPQKGIDYFTEEDVRELTENVLDQGVLTYNEQELTEDQKAQARENIGIDQISFNELTEDLDADGFRITNLPLPQSGSEPATREFVENFTIEGSTYVATDDGEGNVTIRPYLADEDELVFKSHIQNQNNPHNVTAAQVGARPNTWTPTAAEVGAATPQDVNAAKEAANAYTNTQVKKASPRNLLDNSDFRNPVNQRGKTSYTGNCYTIDRWLKEEKSTVSITSDGITIDNLNSDTYECFIQKIDSELVNKLIGKTITIAMCKTDGTIYCNSGIVAYNIPIAQFNAGNCTLEMHLFEDAKSWQGARLSINNGLSISISWIALYEGEYTAETLPEYQPKGYENELLVCRQYDPSTGKYIGLRKFGQPRNLLDNSDFRNPVNQRGQQSYTNNAYTIDRWQIWNGSLSIADGYITVDGMYQFLELPLDKVYTFAVCRDDGNITIVSGSPLVPIAVVNDGMTINITNLAGYVEVVVSGNKNVVWAALYEGEYTIDTLPEYQPKGYGAELAECLRYFERLGDIHSELLGPEVYLGSGSEAFVNSFQFYPKRIAHPSIQLYDTSNYRLLMKDGVAANVYSGWGITEFKDIVTQSPFGHFTVVLDNAITQNSWVLFQRSDNSHNAYIDICADL